MANLPFIAHWADSQLGILAPQKPQPGLLLVHGVPEQVSMIKTRTGKDQDGPTLTQRPGRLCTCLLNKVHWNPTPTRLSLCPVWLLLHHKGKAEQF